MSGSKSFLWTMLGFVALADAHAATITLEPEFVAPGGSMVFHITTELANWPDDHFGAEWANTLTFTGPSCSNGIYFNGGQYGRDYDLPLPNPPPPGITWWGPNFNFPYGCQNLKPGSYLVRFNYNRFENPAQVLATPHEIDLTFEVLENLAVYASPFSIPTGGATSLNVTGVDARDPATALQVECPDGSVDHATDVTPIADGFSIIWPGPYFEGSCDSSQLGEYGVTLTTELRSDTARFRVFGDRDHDGWLDGYDNCPIDPNPGQEDVDHDRQGDACDLDNDLDGVLDDDDNCPDIANASQDDLDVDGLGDVCDPDIEDDGVLNAGDNCPNHYNPDQANADGDPFGDPCDPDPEDADNDGVSDLVDNCPPPVFNPAQQDDDGDGIGSACDPDIDGDGISNANEAVAGTNPNDPQPLEAGINPFWEGGAIGSGASVPDGEPVGVVIDPAPDVYSIDVTVVDPWGNPYSQQTLIPQSPVAFYFVPVWPGTWRIDADQDNGEMLSATVEVIPEPAALFGCLAAVATLSALRRRAR